MNSARSTVLVLSIIVVSVPSCTDDPVSPENDILTDIDGNVYQVVEIGGQWWMSEDLRTSRYRNGDDIPSGLSDAEWSSTTSGAHAVYPHFFADGIDSREEMRETYGALYNWYAIADPRGLCPSGWRVPSDAEWMQLEIYLGMSREEAELTNRRGTTEGGKLKATQTDPDPHPRWRAPNTGATDESGWSGLPGGYRTPDGRFGGLGHYGWWWTATEYDTGDAWDRFLYHDFSFVYRFSNPKPFGRSVRCLKG